MIFGKDRYTWHLQCCVPGSHPKTGVYWLRKRVPDALQPFVGKREEKLSLRTQDRLEAYQRHPIAEVRSVPQISNQTR